ncbi:MAG: hypothetical protein II863_19190 [Kiritimatiellae bacterium]|nr:hypothetical protein [Kiritimatiellia bacterium]
MRRVASTTGCSQTRFPSIRRASESTLPCASTMWAGTNNASKQVPCLAADIFGDWREELVLRREDNRAIRIYMTDIPTPYRFHAFLEDPVYRSSVATLNVDYNQPTHTGFYFGPDLLGRGI